MFSHLPNHFKGHRKPHRATGQNIARGPHRNVFQGGGILLVVGQKGFQNLGAKISLRILEELK